MLPQQTRLVQDNRIIAALGNEFQQEIIQIFTGSFAQVRNFRDRVQKVLRAMMPDEGRSADSRQELINKALAVLKANLRLPDISRDCIYDSFDPVAIVN